MRLPRIKAAGTAGVYHCVSRIVGGQLLLGDLEKEKLTEILLRVATFCGVEVITYCMMSNHFHVLVRVPPPGELADQDLLERLADFYGRHGVLWTLAREALEKRGRIDADLRQQVLARLGDVSVFMKEFKQRFSRWYNRRHGRFGTLWAERFTSVLVEDSSQALRTVAAYIDLNPVRAGLASDPKDYRFCGYAAALAGDRSLRRGLLSCLEANDWDRAAADYRLLLFVTGGATVQPGRQAVERESIRTELARGGQLSVGEILRLRIRHFTDGVALGSKDFVNGVFARYRDRFGPRRRDGARPIRGAQLSGLRVLRDLRVDALG